MVKKKHFKKHKVRGSFFTSVVSISLVLFLLGVMGLLLLNAHYLSSYVKENIGFSLILKTNAKSVEIRRIQKVLDASEFVKSTRYIDAETAAKELEIDLGEDFIKFIGYNPLSASIDVKLYAKYANVQVIKSIEEEMLSRPVIKEVFYHESLIHLVNSNVKNISLILLFFSFILFVISYAIINNTIRLAIYSQRFIINTMQLVGATSSFIKKPFIKHSFYQGLLSGLISNVMLLSLVYFTQKEFSSIMGVNNFEGLLLLFLGIMCLGVFLTCISTLFVVSKFLKIDFKNVI